MSSIKFHFRTPDRFLLVQLFESFAGWLGMIQREIVEFRCRSVIAFQSLTLSAYKRVLAIPFVYSLRFK